MPQYSFSSALSPWIVDRLSNIRYFCYIAVPNSTHDIPNKTAWVLPLAVMFVGYLQHIKDKADAGVAMGVVTDANVSVLVYL